MSVETEVVWERKREEEEAVDLQRYHFCRFHQEGCNNQEYYYSRHFHPYKTLLRPAHSYHCCKKSETSTLQCSAAVAGQGTEAKGARRRQRHLHRPFVVHG